MKIPLPVSLGVALLMLTAAVVPAAPAAAQRATLAQAGGPIANVSTSADPDGPRTTPFPDVPRSHWAYDAVEQLRRLGIVRGYPPEPLRRIPARKPSAPRTKSRRA